MPDWIAMFGGWLSLTVGGLGLWRGATMRPRGGTPARDCTGTPRWLVLVESGGLVLAGAAVLLGGGWVRLIWPAAVLMTVGAVHGVRGWPRGRRRRPRSRAAP